MKKSFVLKLLLCMLLVCISAFCFTACGGNDSDNDDSEKNNAQNTPQYSQGLEYTLNADGHSYAVTGIGSCTDTELVIPAEYNGKPVTSIGNAAFVYGGSLTSIIMPNSVTSIGESAFRHCNSLTTINIPNGVISIGNEAFWYCSSLTSITFNGTVEQWNAVEKGFSWDYDVPATKVICTDGEVAI